MFGISCSMSRIGNCYDGAPMKRFFWSLKHATVDTPAATLLSVFKYIETFYNTERFGQTLGCQPPPQFEADYGPSHAAQEKIALRRCPKVLGCRRPRAKRGVGLHDPTALMSWPRSGWFHYVGRIDLLSRTVLLSLSLRRRDPRRRRAVFRI
ncbi:MAG: hypothetical protein SGJ19_00460 [Planctomycetia bacterium]|nr:hypothetical protein [Planctomycetia bacterium]